ncbi:MAG: ribosomal protein [Pseudomonadota bacterium]
MSRVGKMPVTVPQGVDVTINASQISVKGTGGTLSMSTNPLVTIANNAGSVSFIATNESREADAMTGTLRQLFNNMVIGVSKGFEKKLMLVGVGFKAQVLTPRRQTNACRHQGGNTCPYRDHHQRC